MAARAEVPASTLILRGDQYTPAQLAGLVVDALQSPVLVGPPVLRAGEQLARDPRVTMRAIE